MPPLNLSTWSWSAPEFVRCDSIPISDRGFRYGMSVFESIRLSALSGPRYLEAHLALLSAGCAARSFPFDQEALSAAAQLLANWRSSDAMDAFARIYVTAGDGAPTAEPAGCRVYIFIESRERPLKSEYAITISEELCHPPFGGIKTGNYWINLDALRRAQLLGRDEALLFNERAELVSACVGNVFLVHGSRVRTPSVECGARAGVIRAQAIKRLGANECSLFVQDIINADEIFLTNSWIGVMPVASVRERILPPAVFAPRLADL